MKSLRKKTTATLLIAAFMISMFAVAIPIASATTITVDDSGGADYTTIQAAIDAASSGDTIDVAAGFYPEYLHITTDFLTIEGAGIDLSVIDLDGLTPYWHYSGVSKSYASRSGVLISGYLSTDQIVEGVTFKGFTVKNAGLNPPITATGTHTGSDDAAILTDSTKSWMPGALVGKWVHNYGDRDTDYNPTRSYGLITANTATTVTATLSGGMENDWDFDDEYIITYEHFHNTRWIHYPNYDGLRGISIGNGKDITIQNCKITHSGYGGISTGYARGVSTHKYSEGITVDNCIVTDHPSAGISIGNNVGTFTVTNNLVERIKRLHYEDVTREYAGTGIQVSGTKKYGLASGLIADNRVNDNGFIGISLKKYTDGITIEDNRVTGHNFDEDGAGIFFYHWGHPEWCKNHIVRNNVVTENIRGIIAYFASDSVIEDNVIRTDFGVFTWVQAGIKVHMSHDIEVKHNNIHVSEGHGIRIVDSDDNTVFDNSVNNNGGVGILLQWADGNDVLGNRVNHNEVGIKLENSDDNLIDQNTARANEQYDLSWDTYGSLNVWSDNSYKTKDW